MAERLTSRSKVKKPAAPKASKKAAKKKAAPRVAPQVIADAIGGNVTDSAIRDGLREAVKLHEAMKSAGSAYANHKKKLKEIGIYPDDVSWFLGARQREPDDIDAETRRRNRIARIMRLPIGTQLGLFDDGGKGVKGRTVATVVENDSGVAAATADQAATKRRIATNESMEKAMQAGEVAGREGHERDGNPHDSDSPEGIKWDYGWQAGDKQRREKAFEDAKPAGAA